MKTLFFILVFLTGSILKSSAASDTLKIVNWNLEWWADGSTHNASRQVSKTQALMNAIGADIYALVEVVSVDSLNAMRGRLQNGPWAVQVSQYATDASSPSASNYAQAQKMALLYRTSIFRNVTSRALMKGALYAYSDYASGRYPFLITGEVSGADSVWRKVSFVVYHAKALTDDQSCGRRLSASITLKDTLDQRFTNDRIVFLGDLNDDLDTSICITPSPSAYKNFVTDSTDAVSYRSLTLPLSKAGVVSIDGYSSLIDHVIVSDDMATFYISGSARSLRSFVRSTVTNYTSDVSDHYPILTKYLMRSVVPNVIAEPAAQLSARMQLYPNPAQAYIHISGNAAGDDLEVIDGTGRMILAEKATSDVVKMDVGRLPAGLYLLRRRNGAGVAVTQFIKQD